MSHSCQHRRARVECARCSVLGGKCRNSKRCQGKFCTDSRAHCLQWRLNPGPGFPLRFCRHDPRSSMRSFTSRASISDQAPHSAPEIPVRNNGYDPHPTLCPQPLLLPVRAAYRARFTLQRAFPVALLGPAPPIVVPTFFLFGPTSHFPI